MKEGLKNFKMYYRNPLLLISLTAIFLIAFYASNQDYYTSSQANWFLEINHKLSGMPYFWLNVTALGDALVLFPLLSFLIIKNTRAWASLFGAIPLATVLSYVEKQYLAIPRPAAVLDINQFTVVGDILTGSTSCPSGHTITIFTAVSAILFI